MSADTVYVRIIFITVERGHDWKVYNLDDLNDEKIVLKEMYGKDVSE